MSSSPPENRLTAKFKSAPTHYEPIERIAIGGMAEVWRALATVEGSPGFPVAIKRVLPALANEQLYRSMFEDEARLGMLLRHRNIVRVYDARDVAGTFIMVMELVDGTSLHSLLSRAHQRKACMPIPAALLITRQIARALAYAHDASTATGEPLGIVHRDVSPHNVLLSREGAVKLADFGLADANVHQTASEAVGGKFGYMAPEIVRRNPGDRRVDLFALGIVLWEMIAGRRLFQRETDAQTIHAVGTCEVPDVRESNDRVIPGVASLLERLLEPDPHRRIAAAGSVERELDELIQVVDPKVGASDISLLVGLHLASTADERKNETQADMAKLLAQELQQFVEATAGQQFDLGAAPLDPNQFGRTRGSRRT